MAKTHSSNVIELLSGLEPMASLSDGTIARLAGHCSVEAVSAGSPVFKAGESDGKSVYVVSGSVKLTPGDGGADGERIIEAGIPEARYPLDDKQPHGVSAAAESDCGVIRIDMDLLDKLIAEDQLTICQTSMRETAGKDAGKPGESGLLGRLLAVFKGGVRASKEDIDVFAMLSRFSPPMLKNIHEADLKEMSSRMDAVSVRAGSTIIRQGDEGDYYYIIVHGTALVTRQAEQGSEPILLAELGEGETFGEEALLSNAKRNATVGMKTKGTLMRLAKRDFVELLKEPMLKWLSPVEAKESVQRGAKWLDVRSSSGFQRSHLSGAISMPLHELRDRLGELNPASNYVCYCDTGRLSCSAAFLLGQRGYRVGILRGGLQRIAG